MLTGTPCWRAFTLALRSLPLPGAQGPKLQHIFETATVEVVKRAAAQAIRQCRFKHLPYEVLPGAPPINEE